MPAESIRHGRETSAGPPPHDNPPTPPAPTRTDTSRPAGALFSPLRNIINRTETPRHAFRASMEYPDTDPQRKTPPAAPQKEQRHPLRVRVRLSRARFVIPQYTPAHYPRTRHTPTTPHLSAHRPAGHRLPQPSPDTAGADRGGRGRSCGARHVPRPPAAAAQEQADGSRRFGVVANATVKAMRP